MTLAANMKANKIMWYRANMSAKAVQISIDEELLRRVDAEPETRERGRSAFVRSAIESYLRAKRRREIDEAITTAFASQADAMLDEVDDLLDGQAWPDD
jgi:metal-responsive CopG/Arc/MetJ family transcriptional regulator